MYYIGVQGSSGPTPLTAVTSGMSGICSLKYGALSSSDGFLAKEIEINVHGSEYVKIINNIGTIFDFDVAEGDYFNSMISIRSQALYHTLSLDGAFLLPVSRDLYCF